MCFPRKILAIYFKCNMAVVWQKRNTKTIDWRLTFFLQHKTNFEQSVMTKSSLVKVILICSKVHVFRKVEIMLTTEFWIFFWTSFRVLIYLCSNSLLIKVASLVSTVAYWTHVYQWSIMPISQKTGNHIIMGYVIKVSSLKGYDQF